jgi:GPH family glycoside/pentoside/hexuronide:cation symporter
VDTAAEALPRFRLFFPGDPATSPSVTTPTEKLRPLTRLAYGSGEFGPAMAGSALLFFQMIFLTNVAGLRADLAGSVLLIGKLWVAINDPLIGWLSDRTRTRWGRRLPWMVVSALPLSIFFWMLWLVPGFIDANNQWALFAYFTVVSVLFDTFFTGFILPHNTLTSEFTQDYDERSRISGFRMAFAIGGTVGGLLVGMAIFGLLAKASAASQFQAIALTIASISTVVSILCIAGIWRTAVQIPILEPATPAAPLSPVARITTGLRIIFSNRPYVIVVAIYLFSWLAMQLTASFLSYYVVNYMRLPFAKFALLVLVVQCTALVLLLPAGWLSVRWGKKPVYFIGMIVWLFPQLALIFVPADQFHLVLALAALAGFGTCVCYLIPNAMLPDTIEYDELQTGERRGGIFYGFFVFVQKAGLAVTTYIVGWALQLSGFVSSKGVDVVQPDSALLTIRVCVGILPAIAILVGLWFAWLYPITKAKHAEILRQLAARGARTSA